MRGISFDVKKGEAIGLIGHNGCGKSTTLKLLTRIIYPDSGTIEIKGRVSSLIELGAGFHPDMSGRENIYINASIFGLSKKEIDSRVDEIIRFSEMEEFIDNPVRTYSSGMYMRLAFAVAINVDAEVLLIDEILAVGDLAFQKKCFRKLKEIKANGTTIVIVSHALGQIEEICEKSYWIDEGLIRMSGKPEDVHAAYEDFMENRGTNPLKNAALDSELSETDKQVWTKDGVMIDSISTVLPDEKENVSTSGAYKYLDFTKQMKISSKTVSFKAGDLIPIETSDTCYGPYIPIPAGRYCIEYALSGKKKSSIVYTLTITALAGKDTIARVPVKVGINRIEIQLQQDCEGVEFVLTNDTLTQIGLQYLRIASLE